MKPTTRSFYEEAVRGAVARVAASLDASLDLPALARLACLSPFHFHRIFKGMIGETPLELHRRLRMERAAAALLADDTQVIEIAFAAGYETHESFTRAFARYFGCSPTAFRARPPAGCAGDRVELPSPAGLHFAALRAGGPITFARSGAPMHVILEDRPALRVAAIRHVGPYDRIGEAFQKLGAIAGPAGLFRPGVEMIAIYHDDPETTPADQLRADAALTLREGAQVPAGLTVSALAGGRYAKTTHEGSYARIGDTWTRLMGEWLPQSGHRVADQVAYEVYRNTPMTVPEDQLRTDLYVPLVD